MLSVLIPLTQIINYLVNLASYMSNDCLQVFDKEIINQKKKERIMNQDTSNIDLNN